MNKWLRRAAGTVGVAGGMLLLAGGAAQADAPTSDAALAPGGLIHNLFTPLGATNLGFSVDVPGTTIDAGLLPDGPLALQPNDGRVGITAHTLTKNGVPQALFFNGKLPDVLSMLPIQGLVPPGIVGPVTNAAFGTVGGVTDTLADTTRTAAGFQSPAAGVHGVATDVSNTLVGPTTEGLPLVGGLVDNLPVVGGLLGDNGPLGNLPVVGSLLNGAGGGLPIVGGLVQNLPLVGWTYPGPRRVGHHRVGHRRIGADRRSSAGRRPRPEPADRRRTHERAADRRCGQQQQPAGRPSGRRRTPAGRRPALRRRRAAFRRSAVCRSSADSSSGGNDAGDSGLLGGGGLPLNGLTAGLPLAGGLTSGLPLVGGESATTESATVERRRPRAFRWSAGWSRTCRSSAGSPADCRSSAAWSPATAATGSAACRSSAGWSRTFRWSAA